MIDIYTDGAFSSSRNQGGIGVVVLQNDEKIFEYSNMYKRTTNNQMELIAVIIALSWINQSFNIVNIYTDSKYVQGCAILGWKRKKNVKLWKKFDEVYQKAQEFCPNINFIHIRGHQIDDNANARWNNYVDKLAVKASTLL